MAKVISEFSLIRWICILVKVLRVGRWIFFLLFSSHSSGRFLSASSSDNGRIARNSCELNLKVRGVRGFLVHNVNVRGATSTTTKIENFYFNLND